MFLPEVGTLLCKLFLMREANAITNAMLNRLLNLLVLILCSLNYSVYVVWKRKRFLDALYMLLSLCSIVLYTSTGTIFVVQSLLLSWAENELS